MTTFQRRLRAPGNGEAGFNRRVALRINLQQRVKLLMGVIQNKVGTACPRESQPLFSHPEALVTDFRRTGEGMPVFQYLSVLQRSGRLHYI